MPAFCSVCGSRSQSRRRLGGASVSLRNQLELLREIQRQQAQDIDVRSAECKWLEDTTRRRLSGTVSLEVPPTNPEIYAFIARVRAEVERLQCEVGVWRGAPWDTTRLVHCGEYITECQEEANHELERKQWHAETSKLEGQLREVQERLGSVTLRPGSAAEFADQASAPAEVGYFRDELTAERSAAFTARSQLSALRLEVEEERKSKARSTSQGEQLLAATMEDIALTERRVEVEIELQRAQQAQLESVQTTIVTLKAQVEKARQEANELRASMEQNQETLRRLRH